MARVVRVAGVIWRTTCRSKSPLAFRFAQLNYPFYLRLLLLHFREQSRFSFRLLTVELRSPLAFIFSLKVNSLINKLLIAQQDCDLTTYREITPVFFEGFFHESQFCCFSVKIRKTRGIGLLFVSKFERTFGTIRTR